MKTTAQYLDAMREKLDLPSDGKLADHLGIHRQHMSRYRTGVHGFDEMMCIKVAEILEIEPERVLVDMMYFRAKQPAVKAAWKHTAEMFGLAAGVAIVSFVLAGMMPTLPGYDGFNIALLGMVGGEHCILCQMRTQNYETPCSDPCRLFKWASHHLCSAFLLRGLTMWRQ